MLSIQKFDMRAAIEGGLRALGIFDQVLNGPTGPKRLDSAETATFARELEYIFAEVYRREFPDLVGRSAVPVKPGPGPGHTSHTYTEVERFGEAKIIDDFAKDFPSTEVQGHQFSQVIRHLGDSYQYSIQDLRASALTKIHLPTEKAEMAREAIERLLDNLILSGDSNRNLVGLNSSSQVSNYNSVTKGTQTTGTNWTTATPKEILADVTALMQSVPNATLNRHMANTLVLDTVAYNHIAFTPLSALDVSGNTIGFAGKMLLDYLLANVPGLKEVTAWARLNTAGASGHSRAFCYDKNPQVLYQVIPQEFEQFPPQPKGMAFVVPCHLSWGGVVTPYPKAISYMDQCGS